MKSSVIYFMFVISLVSFISCNHILQIGRHESLSNESKVITINGQTDFTVENTNGTINISASDTANNIYCNITKEVKSSVSKSDAHSHLNDITINTIKTSTGVNIKVVQPNNDGRTYIIKFEITMPDNFNYNLNLGNGDVSVNSSTKNMAINIGNGKAYAGVVLNDKCDISISVGNGKIKLRIPGSTNAAMDAKVGNGSVSNEGLSFEDTQSSSRYFSGKLGSGTGSIDLSVGNGNIDIRKK